MYNLKNAAVLSKLSTLFISFYIIDFNVFMYVLVLVCVKWPHEKQHLTRVEGSPFYYKVGDNNFPIYMWLMKQ